MREYLDTGVENLVMSSRVVFGLHASGNMFAMSACLKPLEDCFTLIMHDLKVSENFLLVSSKSLRVLAADQQSLSLLGVC